MKYDKPDSENSENSKKSDSDFDYKRIFNENIKFDGKNNIIAIDKKEKKIKKEKRYIATFLIQSIICLIIIGSILITKYTNSKAFVSVSSVLNGLYDNNITLSDLNRLIDEKILKNDALATFFNMPNIPVDTDEN